MTSHPILLFRSLFLPSFSSPCPTPHPRNQASFAVLPCYQIEPTFQLIHLYIYAFSRELCGSAGRIRSQRGSATPFLSRPWSSSLLEKDVGYFSTDRATEPLLQMKNFRQAQHLHQMRASCSGQSYARGRGSFCYRAAPWRLLGIPGLC